jgi:hypothetical protein
MKQDSQWLELGDKTYRALRGQGLVLIDLDAVERSIISGDAGQALYQLMEQYRSQEMLDGKAIAVFQRAMTGWVLGAGTEGGADQMAAPASPIVWLNSWRGALKALDQYPWPNLYPLAVHSDFRKKIVSALKVRLPVDDESAWRSWLDLLAQQAR